MTLNKVEWQSDRLQAAATHHDKANLLGGGHSTEAGFALHSQLFNSRLSQSLFFEFILDVAEIDHKRCLEQ